MELCEMGQRKKNDNQNHSSVTCPQMYFNSTLTDSSKLLKPLLVFSFVICAIICGLTRIIQYKNHAIDVYLGFLLGSAIAVYLVRVSLVSQQLKVQYLITSNKR